MRIDLAFSTCPNDTFIFDAMVNGRIDTAPYEFNTCLNDVEELNRRAMAGEFHMTKVSFHALLYLDEFAMLGSGAAMGFGCGPLLVTAGSPSRPVEKMRIAVPGRYTTAALLLKLWNPGLGNIVVERFDRIMDGILDGSFDAGVVIHEGRFVYADRGLRKMVDLGEWWEGETSLPVPLGCIACRKTLGPDRIADLDRIMEASVRYARANPAASEEYVRRHAMEMDPDVIRNHIALYVNDYTERVGDAGYRAMERIREMARRAGLA